MIKSILLIGVCLLGSLLAKCPDNVKCPFKNGVCCNDEKTCCPKGYICDMAGSKLCVSSDEYIRFPVKRKALEMV